MKFIHLVGYFVKEAFILKIREVMCPTLKIIRLKLSSLAVCKECLNYTFYHFIQTNNKVQLCNKSITLLMCTRVLH